MSDIMEATGLEKGAIYRYFASKEALAEEALRFAISEVQSTRLEKLSDVPTALGQLQLMIARFVNTPAPIQGGCPLLNTAVDSDDGNAALLRLVRKAFEDWRNRIVEILEAGKKSGEIRPEVEAEPIADAVISGLEGGLVLSRLDRSRSPLKHVETMLSLLLASLAPSQVAQIPDDSRSSHSSTRQHGFGPKPRRKRSYVGT